MPSMLCRNCLIRESPTGHLVKIADFAILRSSYSKEYRTPRTAREDVRDVDGGGNKSIVDGDAQDVDHYGSGGVGAKEVLPLRWIPWEVYTLVSIHLGRAFSTESVVWMVSVNMFYKITQSFPANTYRQRDRLSSWTAALRAFSLSPI